MKLPFPLQSLFVVSQTIVTKSQILIVRRDRPVKERFLEKIKIEINNS